MKVRLDSKKIRFRISEKELIGLADDKIVAESFEFPNDNILFFNIKLDDTLKKDITFKIYEGKYTLLISRKVLTSLQENPKLKNGYTATYLKKDGTSNIISLEIDLKSI